MKMRQLAHQTLRTLHTEAVLDAVQGVRYQNRRCVEAFLERCQEETFRKASQALPLLVEAPEYVKRCGRSVGEEAYWNYLVRAYGILGSGMEIRGSSCMALAAFEEGRTVPGADALELAALECRASMMEVGRGRWRLALHKTDEAVARFEHDRGRIRDDRSLSTSLAYRGLVRLSAYRQGEAVDLDTAIADYQRALQSSVRRFKRTRLAAVAGLGACAVALWFSGRSTRVATPQSIVETMTRFRAVLRREDIPCHSVVDSKARWILGVAMWKLLGGLSTCAESHLREAQAVLMEIGSPQDVAELTFDLQWCLIEDRRWAAALAECALLEELCRRGIPGWTMANVMMWRGALAQRSFNAELVRQVFRDCRGVQVVVQTRPTDDTLIGF